MPARSEDRFPNRPADWLGNTEGDAVERGRRAAELPPGALPALSDLLGALFLVDQAVDCARRRVMNDDDRAA